MPWMPDLSASYDIPNPFALFASDFAYDLAGYRAALGFLSDLAGGSEHDHALGVNGGNPAQLRAWQSSDKFRRVYAKCRAAGEREQEWNREHADSTWEDDGGAAVTPTDTGAEPTQRFVPLQDAPLVTSVFPPRNPASWGDE